MISISKKYETIIINCTQEVKVQNLKEIVKTIKFMNNTDQYSCKIIVNDFEKITFSKTGQNFFNKFLQREVTNNTRISLQFV